MRRRGIERRSVGVFGRREDDVTGVRGADVVEKADRRQIDSFNVWLSVRSLTCLPLAWPVRADTRSFG